MIAFSDTSFDLLWHDVATIIITIVMPDKYFIESDFAFNLSKLREAITKVKIAKLRDKLGTKPKVYTIIVIVCSGRC